MNQLDWLNVGDEALPPAELLWEDGGRMFVKVLRRGADGQRHPRLAVVAASENLRAEVGRRLSHEYTLKEHLDPSWALRPVELIEGRGQVALVLCYQEAEPLGKLLAGPMEMGSFLRLGVLLAGALARLHECGLLHRDIKPSNILVDTTISRVWLTGFGVASPLPRAHQPPLPPEFIAGTLSHMAPEQTGRMNRSADSRSDLYSFGITLYQTLTGCLPFTADDPMEWVHCHIAKKPPTPTAGSAAIPPQITAIVMKLLAKTPEERYQTARGAEHDLRRCLSDWERGDTIDGFRPGESDMPDRLHVSEKLYGREREINMLVGAFDRIVEGGPAELVLVSGYSGIGKSALVSEVHKVLAQHQGTFAAGKFDQYKRHIPYSSLAQAIHGLVRPLLTKSDSELDVYREAMSEAVGTNGQLLVDIVPDLKFVIGEQASVLQLQPEDAQRRFHMVFRRFLAVFARAGQPLALFIDDLQWVDTATRDLLEDLVIHEDVRNVLLIGAYRDNEVTAAHPLMRSIERIRDARAAVQYIVLAPLACRHVADLIADTLRCDQKRVGQLAEMVHQMTAGNPFFVIQFLETLAEEGEVRFDHPTSQWIWDLERIRVKGYTDNVADLMVGKLRRLPIEAQNAMQQLACLGNRADFELIQRVSKDWMGELHRDLQAALQAGLMLVTDSAYFFLHDRVQEAVYLRIPKMDRAKIHLRIGRALVTHGLAEKRDEAVFEVVSHLNRASALIEAPTERWQLAELNLVAGKRAKSSAAYPSALEYFAAGASLISEGGDHQPDLRFLLELHRAECEFLMGELLAAESRLEVLARRAQNLIQRSAVTCLRLDLYVVLGAERAIEVFLEYARALGLQWRARPTEDHARRESEKVLSLLGDRPVEDLINLPVMTDPESLAIVDVLSRAGATAYMLEPNLWALIYSFLVGLSIQRGNSESATYAYVNFGMAAIRLGEYDLGYRFGHLGNELAKRQAFLRFRARTAMTFAYFIVPWRKGLGSGRSLIRQALAEFVAMPDVTYAAYACINIVVNRLAAGDALGGVQRETEDHLSFTEKRRFFLASGQIKCHLMLVRTLRGLTDTFGCFNEPGFDEGEFEQTLLANARFGIVSRNYWIRKLQARFFAQDFASALEASKVVDGLRWDNPSIYWFLDYTFYKALAHAAALTPTSPEPPLLEALRACNEQLRSCACISPENFDAQAALTSAELARVEGRKLDAQRLYEEAVNAARRGGFVQIEALANELAARFYDASGPSTSARAYLRNARDSYFRWEATGKVRQLDELYPHLRDVEPLDDPTRTQSTPAEHLDLVTVLRVLQAVSGETDLGKLTAAVMRLALEHAGAQRGLLIVPQGDVYRIEAEAKVEGDSVVFDLRQVGIAADALPESVLNYVLRTKKSVLLQDASSYGPFSNHPYIRQNRSRSLLCLPLLKQARVIGIIYLENNLTPGAFTAARLALLELLASEAATSLENARLYCELQERNAKIRRLFNANIIGIFTWSLDGRIIEANQSFRQLTGFSGVELDLGEMHWKTLVPPEQIEAHDITMTSVLATGVAPPFEAEYVKKDGSRVPVLIGASLIDGTPTEGVAFVLDLTERKRAEEAARDSDRRYHKVEIELSDASRVASIAHLSAAIAHEINQPLSGVITNASTGLRMLNAEPPNIDIAREALKRIARDGNRASDVLARLRALFGKKEFIPEPMNINDAMREVIGMSRSDLQKDHVVLQLLLAESVPLVIGDRIQIQQVLLNLLRNACDALSCIHDRQRLLVVKTECDADVVRVSVRDSGTGIHQAHMNKVFDAFYSTKSEGMGIGLSVSRSIIERHGGRLWAEANEDHGVTFAFCIPLGPNFER